MSILIFFGVLFVLVLVHELGHFAVAKWTGMRVDEFGIGFPPKLFGIKKGETLYSINVFPVGGFVKIFGEDMEAIGVESEDARTRSFTSKSKWAQSAVLIAGITMNILFAWMLMVVVFTMGVETAVTEADATENARLTITSVLPGSPADKVAIVPGSVVKSIQAGNDTLTQLTPVAFSEFVESHAEIPLTLVYTYKGEPRMVEVESETKVITSAPEQHALGVALTQIDTVERSFGESVLDAFVFTVIGLRDIAVGLASLLYDAIRMEADFSQVAGPVGIVGLVGEASSYGITALLMFTAFISLNLAVINILPFPALDGGRLLFVIIEAVKGTPINPRFSAIANTVGFALLIMLMIAVTWNDVTRLI